MLANVSKPLLVVDLVGTIEDNWQLKRQWLGQRGYELPFWQPPRSDIVTVVGEEVYREMKRAVATPAQIPNDPPIPGSVEALRLLRPVFQVAVLSTRAADLHEPTQEFMERYFAGLYDELHLMGDVDGIATVTKLEWAAARNAFAFVDDDARHFVIAPQCGVLCFLLNLNARPTEVPPSVTLATSWREISETLLSQLSAIPQLTGVSA